MTPSAKVDSERRLDVHDGRPVERLDRPDAQPISLDRPNRHAVQPQRVRPVRGTSREDSRHPIPLVGPGTHAKHVAPRAVQPRDDQDLVAGRKALEPLRLQAVDLEPRVGRAFGALPRCVAAPPELGPDDTDGSQPQITRQGSPCLEDRGKHRARRGAATSDGPSIRRYGRRPSQEAAPSARATGRNPVRRDRAASPPRTSDRRSRRRLRSSSSETAC